MRILHTVEFYAPSTGGAQTVVQQISERLVRRGHDLTVATSMVSERRSTELHGVRIAEFPISGNAVRGFSGDVEQYQAFVRSGNFDVMMNYAAQQWTFDALASTLAGLSSKKVLVPCGFSGLYWKQYHAYYQTLPDVLRQYDALVFLSTDYRDVNFARQHGINRWTVIPNGAAADEFDAKTIDFRTVYGVQTRWMLLTVGSHAGTKGHRLAIDSFRRVDIRNATLVIIGNATGGGCTVDCRRRTWLFNIDPRSRQKRKRIMLLDPPRPHVVAAYKSADLFVFGSSIECSPLVLFEAMAAGLPFVTTPVGNAQEIVGWGHGGVTVPAQQNDDGFTIAQPKTMARAITALFHDAQQLARLSAAGRQAWRDRFTFEGIALQYEQLYTQLVNGTFTPTHL